MHSPATLAFADKKNYFGILLQKSRSRCFLRKSRKRHKKIGKVGKSKKLGLLESLDIFLGEITLPFLF